MREANSRTHTNQRPPLQSVQSTRDATRPRKNRSLYVPMSNQQASLFETLTSAPISFDGPTYDAETDEARLTGLLEQVFELMKDRKFRTLQEIKKQLCCNAGEASISARLRDLRKPRFGAHTVNRRRRGEASAGVFEYQLTLRERSNETD